MKYRGIALLAALVPVLSVAPAALAVNGPNTGGLSVVPNPKSTHTNPAHTSVRVGTLPVGHVFTETAAVVNSTSKPMQVYVYPADGVPARGGGYGYRTRGQKMTEIGAWTRVSVSTATVPAGGRIPLTFRLQIPATAPDRLYVGAIVAEPVQRTVGGQIATVTRYAMPVSVTSTGGLTPSAQPTPGRPGVPSGPLDITDLKPHQKGSHACPTVRVTNNGTAPAAPTLTVTSDGWFGKSRHTTTIAPVAPGASTVVQLPCVRRPLGPGKLRVTGDGLPTVAAGLWWLPLALWISLLLLLLLIGALLTTFVRGMLERREEDVAPEERSSSHKELEADHPS